MKIKATKTTKNFKQTFIILIFLLSTFIVNAQSAGGTYTINKNAAASNNNFVSFNAAYNSIKLGVISPVIFNVVAGSGPYNEQLVINGKIPNASPLNTITFNGNGNTIQFSSLNTIDRAVIKLKGAKYFIFDSLNVDASNGNFGFGFHLLNDADSNIIRRCIINSSLTSTTAGNTAGIAISSADNNAVGVGAALCDYNQILNNTITGGYFGITQTADFVGGANGFNTISNNKIFDFYRYGIYVIGSYNTTIQKNKISRPTRTNIGAFDGIYFTGQSNSATISANRIFSPFKAATTSSLTFNGINFDNASATVTNDHYVYNNAIYDVVSNGGVTGISNQATSNIQYSNNTISLDDATSTTAAATRGFSQTSSSLYVVIANNMITITRGGTGIKHCIYLIGLPIFCDYNNFYISSSAGNNYIGFYVSNKLTLALFEAAIGSTANVSIDPIYYQPLPANDTSNYSPTNAALNNKGFNIGIIYDINGNIRDANDPDIGAYEFTAPPCVPGSLNGTTTITIYGKAPAGDTSVCQNTEVKLDVNMIGGYGSGQTFQWQRVADTTQTPIAFVANLTHPDTTFNINDSTFYYRCKISCSGSIFYTNWRKISSVAAMPAGNYTINSNAATNYIGGVASGNFNSYNAANNALKQCGIVGNGNVVFNVVPLSGPYLEQLKMDSIIGANVNNRVIFKGNNTTLQFPVGSPTNGAERAVIKLSKTDFVIFDSLIIDASAATTYGYGVQLINNADSNTIKNCNIYASQTSTLNTINGIVINATDAGTIVTGNTLCDGNVFDNNTINGGYYGITLVGSATNFIRDNVFKNNKIFDFYRSGLFIAGTSNTVVDGNTFSRPYRTNLGLGIGVDMNLPISLSTIISNNQFTNFYGGQPNSTSGMYGVYSNNIDATVGSENLVYNNIFYNIDGLGFAYPLYNSGSDNFQYYHNTIALDNPSVAATGTGAGFYQTTAATGIKFQNNIVRLTRGGTVSKYCIYLATTATSIVSNNNILNVDSVAKNGFTGFYAGNRKTLVDWQNATSPKFDSLSYYYNPLFVDTLTGFVKPQFYLIDNKAENVGITTDITGATRSGTPDIGAYEFSPSACASPLLAGTASITPNIGNCLNAPIQLNLAGHSALGSINFQWQDSIEGGIWQNVGSTVYSPQLDIVTTARNYYRCIVTCAASGIASLSTTVKKEIGGAMPAGTYNIDSATGTNYSGVAGQNFNTFEEAATAMQCGILGSVVFNVKKGTYNEQVRIANIPGASATAPITFQSFNGNAISVKLICSSSTAIDNYTLKYDSAKYVTFKNISIENTNLIYSRVVDFSNGANNCKLLNCNLKTVSTVSTSNSQSVIFSSPTRGVNLTIKGNTITGGSMGIYFTGTSGSASSVLASAGHVIDSNLISENYGAGIFAQFSLGLKVTRNKITYNAASAVGTAGIYASYCDSGFSLTNNRIEINNTNASIFGIVMQNTSNSTLSDLSEINGNEIYANTGNTGKVTGIYLPTINYLEAKNNVISINSADATGAYGIQALAGANNVSLTNNSIAISIPATTSAAVHLTQNAYNKFTLTNNIFSNTGGGRAMYMNSPSYFTSNYNMLYSVDTNFISTLAGLYQNFNSWKNATNKDRNSIFIQPSFTSNTNLQPAPTNSNSWALQGRGIQIKGNNKDIDGNYRPDSLTAGVPDLGAFEFTPTAQPTSLAIPATPTPNTEQTFYLGSDTIMKIKWGATVPATVAVKRFSGIVPPNINIPAHTDSMFFYTKVEVPAGNYPCDIKLNYLSSWLGSIPTQYNEYQLGLGQTNGSGNWSVGVASSNSLTAKTISQNNVTYLDKFTGLFNQYTPPAPINIDSSNSGKEFWVAYPANQLAGDETYQLYLSATEPATVTVSIPSLNWTRTYNIAANTVKVSDNLPQAARHDLSGLYSDAINISSDVPIVAYAHCWGIASSGATMLLPTGVWGYEYKSLAYHQNWGAGSFSSYFVVAKEDNTKVSVANTVPVSVFPQTFDTVLNKGQWLQILAASSNDDLSGSSVKSVANSVGKCYPIALFSGDTRTSNSIPCGGGGDFMMQQSFPAVAWGKKYLTAPTSQSTSVLTQASLFRISLKDTTQTISINGLQVYPTGVAQGFGFSGVNISSTITPSTTIPAYVEFKADSACYLASNMPMMVAQFFGGACTGTGDPEMIYLSPIEQGVNNATFYRNTTHTIDANVLTLIGSTNNVPSICEVATVGGPCISTSWTKVYTHSNYPGKSVYIKHWPTAAQRQVTVSGDSSFTGITYGLGSVESYAYNIGTLVKSLNAVSTNSATGSGFVSTCKGGNFQISTSFPFLPDSITWQLNSVLGITPVGNVILKKPYGITPVITVKDNGDSSFKFTLPTNYKIDSAGFNTYNVKFWDQNIEGCEKTITSLQYISVLPAPTATENITICSNQLPYSWRGTSYAAAGTYTKTIVSAGNCDSSITLVLDVTNKPVISSLSFNNPIVLGDTIKLSITATNATNYTWTGPNSYVSQQQNPVILMASNANIGMYYVTVSNGVCSTKDSVVIELNGASYTVNGRVITAAKKVIANAKISLSGATKKTQFTDLLGGYKFTSLTNGNYTFKVARTTDITKANGVNSVDALLVQRHILNTTKLNSAYKLIAADVNGDKNINSVDVLRIKRLILGTDTIFSSSQRGNRFWEFVDSAYQFPDTTNPFPFKDSISFTNLTSNKKNQTFIGVKLGDVNYDWNPAVARMSTVNSVMLEASISNVQLAIDNKQIAIVVKASNFKDIAAMQYTLHFDNSKYEFEGIENNKLNIDFNAAQSNATGNIAMLWTDKKGEAISLEDGTTLFELILRPKFTVDGLQLNDNSKLQTVNLSLTNDITNTEAWDKDFNQHNIILKSKVKNKNPKVDNNGFSIFPNPASGFVYIENLNAKQILITDYLGRKKAYFNAKTESINHLKVNIQHYPKGVYIVQFTMQDGTTKNEKLVVE